MRVGGWLQDCLGQLQINQAGVKCLCCFSPPLPSLPALLKINNCVNSRVIVLGQQPPGLPGLGRCWQGLPSPTLGAGWAWLPGLQDKQGRTQAGQEGGCRQEGEQVSQEHCRHKGPLVSSPLAPGSSPPPPSPRPVVRSARGRWE